MLTIRYYLFIQFKSKEELCMFPCVCMCIWDWNLNLMSNLITLPSLQPANFILMLILNPSTAIRDEMTDDRVWRSRSVRELPDVRTLVALSQNIRIIMFRGEVDDKMYEYDDDKLLLLIFLSTKKFRFIVD